VKIRPVGLCFLLAAALAPAFAQSLSSAPVELSPPEWKYGMIEQGDVARTRVVARNLGKAPLSLTFIPTCTCLTVTPASARLEGGASAAFDLSFDSKDDYGITQRGYIVKTDAAGAKPLYYLLSGVVRVDRPSGAKAAAGAGPAAGAGAAAGAEWPSGSGAGPAPGGRRVELYYYYTPGCRSCEEFLAVEIPALEDRYSVAIDLKRRDLLQGESYGELSAFASSIGSALRAIPALRLDGVLLQGDEEIRSRLPGLLVTKAAGGSLSLALPWSPPASAAGSAASPNSAGTVTGAGAGIGASLSLLPVMAAGLIDGVNPCAFTTLIFLLASLALAGRGRAEVLAIGALFSLGVFLTYLAVGLGLFAALRAASGVALLSAIIRWVLVAALVAFSGLSLYDYVLIRRGRASEMVLQLPNALKGRIHASIRTRTRSIALAGSSLALGFLVSIFEFACTGQVYLPTLAYLARVQRRTDALLLLLAYNLCFILPLLAVFAASYFGVSSKRITVLFQKRMGGVKLALAAAFLGLAALTLLA
jgi:cytochrome c biogenesis protein CcdA